LNEPEDGNVEGAGHIDLMREELGFDQRFLMASEAESSIVQFNAL